jgi:hypothetical protein
MYIRYGGKVTAVDWIAWPSLGLVSLFGLIPNLPAAWGWLFVGLG